MKALYDTNRSQEQNSVSFSYITCGCSSNLLGKIPKHRGLANTDRGFLSYSNSLIRLSASFICLCFIFLNTPVNYFSQLTIRDKGCSFNLDLHLFPSPPLQLAMKIFFSSSSFCQPAYIRCFSNSDGWRRLQLVYSLQERLWLAISKLNVLLDLLLARAGCTETRVASSFSQLGTRKWVSVSITGGRKVSPLMRCGDIVRNYFFFALGDGGGYRNIISLNKIFVTRSSHHK